MVANWHPIDTLNLLLVTISLHFYNLLTYKAVVETTAFNFRLILLNCYLVDSYIKTMRNYSNSISVSYKIQPLTSQIIPPTVEKSALPITLVR